jgi:hypothetical protein
MARTEGITSTESDEESGDTTMEVGMSALLDAVLNGGVECATNLRKVFANFACGLSSNCTRNRQLYFSSSSSASASSASSPLRRSLARSLFLPQAYHSRMGCVQSICRRWRRCMCA